MTLPTFLILGAQKAGTTSLYWYLRQHPDVFMSPTKEPHFFSFAGTEGPLSVKRSHVIPTQEAYEALFDGAHNERALGEASASALATEQAAQRIKKLIPNARLIAMLRDPAERAHSQFMFNHKRSEERAGTLTHAIQLDEARRCGDAEPAPFGYIENGLYAKHIANFHAHFNPKQLSCYLLEDLRDRPHETLHDIFAFIGVNPGFKPDVSLQYNVSGKPKSRFAGAVIRAYYPMRETLERVVPKKLISRLGQTLITRQKQDQDERAQHIEFFRDDIGQLESILNRDLSHWLS